MNKHPIGKTMADEKNTRRDVMCRVYMNCSTSGLSSQRILYVCKDHLGQDWVRRAHVSRECLSWSPALNGEGVREGVRTYRVWGKANLTDASGAVLPVWHDYMAGTDPTDAASVALEDGKPPVVSWSPALNGEGVREGVRTYRVWGKANLTDAARVEVAPDDESGYRFFRVTVEMP